MNTYVPVDLPLLVIAFLSVYPKEDKVKPVYPNVNADLVGIDGNTFSLIYYCSSKMKDANIPEDEIKKFEDEAFSGNYFNVLKTCCKWVSMPKVQIVANAIHQRLKVIQDDLEKSVKEREEEYDEEGESQFEW